MKVIIAVILESISMILVDVIVINILDILKQKGCCFRGSSNESVEGSSLGRRLRRSKERIYARESCLHDCLH